MPGSRSSNNEAEHKSPRESGDDSEDESEILEESPCGRWLKRKEEVSELDHAIKKLSIFLLLKLRKVRHDYIMLHKNMRERALKFEEKKRRKFSIPWLFFLPIWKKVI